MNGFVADYDFLVLHRSTVMCILKSVFSIKLRPWYRITAFFLPERIIYARRVMSASLVFVAGIISNMGHRKRALPSYTECPLISSSWFSRHIFLCKLKNRACFWCEFVGYNVHCCSVFQKHASFLRCTSVWYKEGWLYLCQSFVIFLYAQLLMVNNIKKISKFLTLPLFSRGFFLSGTP